MNAVGKAVPHDDARGHATGAALFTDDLAGRFPGLLHAWPVLAPHAHARVTAVDASAARAGHGVVTVLTGAEVPGIADSSGGRLDQPMFPAEVQFHRQPVVWVLGETEEEARRGAARVSVEYEPLPATLCLSDAIAAGAFLCGPVRVLHGSPEEALAASPHRLQGRLTLGGQEHAYLETHSTIAAPDDSGGILLHCATQHPAETQAVVAQVLGIAQHRVTVECARLGGGFGGKEVQANPFAAVAALGAWTTGRPVRVRLPRSLDMALTGKRHPFEAAFTVGYDGDGRLLALRLELFGDGGWSQDLSAAVLSRAILHVDNAYRIPALDLSAAICRTHKTSQTAFRGFGGPQALVTVEDVIERIARSLRLPSDVVRERNFYHEGDSTYYGQPVKPAERMPRIWHELKESSRFPQRRQAVASFNCEHRHRKRGLAITPVKFGISFTAPFLNQAGASISVFRDGSVQVSHGGIEMGQGLHTKIRQIAAESLGVAPGAVRVLSTRTDRIPNTSATAASASADLNGGAVVDAANRILSRLAPVAADLLGCDCALVRFSAGTVGREGGAAGLAFAQVVEEAYLRRIPLFAQGYFRTPGVHFDAAAVRGCPFRYFVYGAAVCEVEVDGFTGGFQLLGVRILQDVGNSISRMVDRGQVEGAFVQGLGWLTMEELVWRDDGSLATNGLSTYKAPGWSEAPEEFEVGFLAGAADPDVVYGSKAVGEPPLMLAIAAREAIRDAVAAFGDGGLVLLDSPATPERIFWAIQSARRRAG
jgi:xanthine dehydrogenase large subunit